MEVHAVDDTILTSGTIARRPAHRSRVLARDRPSGQHRRPARATRSQGRPVGRHRVAGCWQRRQRRPQGPGRSIAAEHDLKRKKELFEQKAGSSADMEASMDNYRRAKAELERAQQKAYLLRNGNADAVTGKKSGGAGSLPATVRTGRRHTCACGPARRCRNTRRICKSSLFRRSGLRLLPAQIGRHVMRGDVASGVSTRRADYAN